VYMQLLPDFGIYIHVPDNVKDDRA